MTHAQVVKRRQGILLLGHGSLVDADSAQVVHLHAARLRQSFDEVQVGFWKEPPYLHEALLAMCADDITIVPLFLSQGYFTTKILPRELGLDQPDAIMPRGHQRLRYMSAAGQDASIFEAVLERALHALHAHQQDKPCAILIAAHGTERDPNSAKAATEATHKFARALAQLMAPRTIGVALGFIDQAPSLNEALNTLIHDATKPQHIIVIPFFISEGMHVRQDLPQLIQSDLVTIEQTEAMGTTASFTKIIEGLAKAPWPEGPTPLDERRQRQREALSLPARLGQLHITQEHSRWIICHHQDSPHTLTTPCIKTALALRERTRHNEHGIYRPLPYALDLPRGWWAQAQDHEQAIEMIEAIYPMMLHYARWDVEGDSPAVELKQTLARQSGRAAKLSDLPEDLAMKTASGACARCALTPLWTDPPQTPSASSPGCPQACPVALERLQALKEV